VSRNVGHAPKHAAAKAASTEAVRGVTSEGAEGAAEVVSEAPESVESGRRCYVCRSS